MEQALEHDPGHVRTREHYEAMLAERMQELQVAAPAPSAAAVFQAQQERVATAIRRGTRLTEKRTPL
jgi:hypothetical protein